MITQPVYQSRWLNTEATGPANCWMRQAVKKSSDRQQGRLRECILSAAIWDGRVQVQPYSASLSYEYDTRRPVVSPVNIPYHSRPGGWPAFTALSLLSQAAR